MFLFNEDAFKRVIQEALFEALQSFDFSKLPSEQQKKVEYLTAREVEKLLKISHTTLYNLIHAGKLKPIKLGRRILFSINDLEQLGGANGDNK
jgi:excisionase family DNA binding protein